MLFIAFIKRSQLLFVCLALFRQNGVIFSVVKMTRKTGTPYPASRVSFDLPRQSGRGRRLCERPAQFLLSMLQCKCNRASINNHTRPSAPKRLDKISVLVPGQSSPPPYRLFCKISKKRLKSCSGPLVKIIILLSVCTNSLNTLAQHVIKYS